ncbi:XPA protein C-terminus-domain-containing protein [Obelidium mucronatum]|nr:XPA protein C-terminus-domain-containing protein [Obelidium mucronatum]
MGDSQQTNRQIALARIASSAIDGSSSLAYSSQSSTSTNASKPTNQQGTKRKGLSLDYCEFNLSTMVDTRGGFLLPEYSLEENPAAATGLELRNQPPVQIPSNAVCRECESIDLCSDLFRHYSMQVCRRCKEEFKDKYSLLTKTEAREDYLLTDSELRDQEKLPHWMKKNPHKDSYANMLLYLRMHVSLELSKRVSLNKF